ncbi:MAG: MBL fold metallo-hydrolase [Leptospirales bacterium]|jgi:hydroxyacylglutathione hydrolase
MSDADHTTSATEKPEGKIDLLTFPVQPLGCNCSILIHKKSREAIVVDPGGEAPKIIELLKEHNADVRWIVHTHAHFDHCLGTHEVAEHARDHGGETGRRKGDPEKSASDSAKNETAAVKVGLHQADMFLYENLGAQCRLFGLPPEEARTAIDHHLQDEEPLTFGDMQLKVLHTPGHTPGSCCFSIEEAGLVFSGDTLFQMGIGRTDLPGGDPEAITKSIRDRLFTLDEGTSVIPGHGRFTRIYEEKQMNPFF